MNEIIKTEQIIVANTQVGRNAAIRLLEEYKQNGFEERTVSVGKNINITVQKTVCIDKKYFEDIQ